MHRLPLVTLILSLTVTAAGAQTRPTADALARSVQQRYQGIHDFSAEFTHVYRGGALRNQVTERGTMAIKKPGMMRWTYTTPEKKTCVSDGKKLYSYFPQVKQDVVSTLPPDDDAP